MKKKHVVARRCAVFAVLTAVLAFAGRLLWGWRQVHADE